jgi:hypothetical protein
VNTLIVRTLVSIAGLTLLACSAYDQPCTCNGRWSDPFARSNQPTVQANVQHYRSDHCSCRCGGEGEELLMPPFQRDCAAFEVQCRTPEGRAARYVCQ